VVVHVNKKFAFDAHRNCSLVHEAAISATPKYLIFVFKLEMLTLSIIRSKKIIELFFCTEPLGTRLRGFCE